MATWHKTVQDKIDTDTAHPSTPRPKNTNNPTTNPKLAPKAAKKNKLPGFLRNYFNTVARYAPYAAYVALGVATAAVAVTVYPQVATFLASFKVVSATSVMLHNFGTFIAAHTPALVGTVFSYLSAAFNVMTNFLASCLNNTIMLQGQILAGALGLAKTGFVGTVAAGATTLFAESLLVSTITDSVTNALFNKSFFAGTANAVKTGVCSLYRKPVAKNGANKDQKDHKHDQVPPLPPTNPNLADFPLPGSGPAESRPEDTKQSRQSNRR